MTTGTLPNNRNFLSPNGFRFLIKKAPYLNFFIQRVNLPGLINPAIENQTPFTNIPQTGDHIEYQKLKVTFKVDEDLKNYLEIYNWIRGLGFSKEFQEYADLEDQIPGSGLGLRSDISLIILNNLRNVNYDITFIDAFPFELSDVDFDTTNSELDYLSATASFAYTYYDINAL